MPELFQFLPLGTSCFEFGSPDDLIDIQIDKGIDELGELRRGMSRMASAKWFLLLHTC